MVTKKYKIEVFKKVKDEDVLIAEINAGWLPEDNDRFAWELGGTSLRISEVVVEDKPAQWPPA